MKPLTIGQIALRAGIGVQTVQFHEAPGCSWDRPTRAAGYRQYAEQAVARLRFIKRAKELGFTLKEIGELLALRLSPFNMLFGWLGKLGNQLCRKIQGFFAARTKSALRELTKITDEVENPRNFRHFKHVERGAA